MPHRENIAAEISLARQLVPLIEASQEIAVMRIARIRDTVLATRSFEKGLSAVFSSVRAAYKQAPTEIADKATALRSAMVLLTTNERLAGPIGAATTQYFLQNPQNESDVIIVGQIGREIWEAMYPDRRFYFFDLPAQNISIMALRPLLEQLLSYQNLTVYYPQYTSVVTQEPTTRNLGSTMAEMLSAEHGDSEERALYLFEPSQADIEAFFNNQIFSVVVKQLFEETELATLGSRITSMENTAYNIRKQLKDLEQRERQQNRGNKDKKQREQLAGRNLWHGKI